MHPCNEPTRQLSARLANEHRLNRHDSDDAPSKTETLGSAGMIEAPRCIIRNDRADHAAKAGGPYSFFGSAAAAFSSASFPTCV